MKYSLRDKPKVNATGEGARDEPVTDPGQVILFSTLTSPCLAWDQLLHVLFPSPNLAHPSRTS